MVPQEELSILESLINIRTRLQALKKASATEYIRPQDVESIYHAVLKQVTKLNDVRDENSSEDQTNAPSSTEVEVTQPNRVDQTLSDVFSLVSLFFLTIGKSRTSVAGFCQLASMRQLLQHMNESGVYTETDLQPFRTRLEQLKQVIQAETESKQLPEAMEKLLTRKWEDSERLLNNLFKSLSVLSVELVPIHQRIVQMRRQLSSLAALEKPPKQEVKALLEELRKIDSKRVDGKFLGPGGSSVPTGQAILSGLLEECFEIAQDLRALHEDEVPTPLKPIFDRLSELRAKLERLQLTHRWTLRETDLYNYSMALQEIDSMRVDGKFVDAEGEMPPEGQYGLLYLLRRCHGLIYKLMSSSEPISEELMPIANKLSTIKKCLNEVLKYGGPFSARDLYPYHLALHQLDSMRKDGKFMAQDGSIPEGQAILVAHLSECHELLEMLKAGMDEEDSD
ncbi:Uncharacterised protein family UPF0662 [Phaffia rhodozyma]|uniref:Uncharacterized protein family UPF0662 n=1 Tax=Phaffia rhodozyma TaxID=264483 RepID=A0A0F7SPV6_PHARH|nr:Uncharacterised protein family UPF0662 [Phaffia rhodozyma]